MFDGGMDELQSDKLEATLLKTTDDIANESPLDTVGLGGRKDAMISAIESPTRVGR